MRKDPQHKPKPPRQRSRVNEGKRAPGHRRRYKRRAGVDRERGCKRHKLPLSPSTHSKDLSARFLSRTPHPPPPLVAPSPISSTPARSSASTIFVRLSTTPRTIPGLDSMRCTVGKETPA